MFEHHSNGHAKHEPVEAYLDKLSTALQSFEARIGAIERRQSTIINEVLGRLELIEERFDQIDTLVQSAKLVRTTM